MFFVLVQVKKHVRKACGFQGSGYSGHMTKTTTSGSNLQCVSICLEQPFCCAVEFVKTERKCILLAKSDNNEETTHALYQDSKKAVFLVWNVSLTLIVAFWQ